MILTALSALLLLIIAIVLINTILLKKEVYPSAEASGRPVNNAVAGKLSRSVRIKTVSNSNYELFDRGPLAEFEKLIEKEFPLVHSKLTREKIGEFGLLYTWKGADPSLKPVMLLSHYDVVPATAETSWEKPPFSGEISGGYIWGRGTLDFKCGVISILEACETLLIDNFTPSRDFYFAFGGDEEIGGNRGAFSIARELEKRGSRLEYLLDEGAVVVEGMLSDIPAPVALIGVAEKGCVNIELTVEGASGHSAMPPSHTAVGILASAVHRIEKKQFRPALTDTLRHFFKTIAPYSAFPNRMFFGNLWLFGKLLKYVFSLKPSTNALIRTTQSVNMISGSEKENVLPDRARAIINMRILPGETIESVLGKITAKAADRRVKAAVFEGWMPNNPVTGTDINSDSYRYLVSTIKKIFPKAIPVPFLVTGSTDSKHYRNLTDSIFRFFPVKLQQKDINSIHGENEKISEEALKASVSFFIELIANQK